MTEDPRGRPPGKFSGATGAKSGGCEATTDGRHDSGCPLGETCPKQSPRLGWGLRTMPERMSDTLPTCSCLQEPMEEASVRMDDIGSIARALGASATFVRALRPLAANPKDATMEGGKSSGLLP